MAEDKQTIARAKAAVKRMNAVRNFPDGTCPCSRHAAMMAEQLAKKGQYFLLVEEPRHCATSIAVTVQALWEARTKLAELGFDWIGGKWVADDGASGGGTGC